MNEVEGFPAPASLPHKIGDSRTPRRIQETPSPEPQVAEKTHCVPMTLKVAHRKTPDLDPVVNLLGLIY
jgi:hypothetical protein